MATRFYTHPRYRIRSWSGLWIVLYGHPHTGFTRVGHAETHAEAVEVAGNDCVLRRGLTL